MLTDWFLGFLNILLKSVIRNFQIVLGVFSQKLSGNPQKNKVVVYLATYNAKGSSGNIVENVVDEECHNFILLIRCPATNKEL